MAGKYENPLVDYNTKEALRPPWLCNLKLFASNELVIRVNPPLGKNLCNRLGRKVGKKSVKGDMRPYWNDRDVALIVRAAPTLGLAVMQVMFNACIPCDLLGLGSQGTELCTTFSFHESMMGLVSAVVS